MVSEAEHGRVPMLIGRTFERHGDIDRALRTCSAPPARATPSRRATPTRRSCGSAQPALRAALRRGLARLRPPGHAGEERRRPRRRPLPGGAGPRAAGRLAGGRQNYRQAYAGRAAGDAWAAPALLAALRLEWRAGSEAAALNAVREAHRGPQVAARSRPGRPLPRRLGPRPRPPRPRPAPGWPRRGSAAATTAWRPTTGAAGWPSWRRTSRGGRAPAIWTSCAPTPTIRWPARPGSGSPPSRWPASPPPRAAASPPPAAATTSTAPGCCSEATPAGTGGPAPAGADPARRPPAPPPICGWPRCRCGAGRCGTSRSPGRRRRCSPSASGTRAAPAVRDHFPLSDPSLAFTGGLLLARAGDIARSIALAEALRPARRARVPLALQPPGLRRLLYPFPYRQTILAQGGIRRVDPLLLAALIREESRFDTSLLSPASSRGLTQLSWPRPAAWRPSSSWSACRPRTSTAPRSRSPWAPPISALCSTTSAA